MIVYMVIHQAAALYFQPNEQDYNLYNININR